ncbi:MAG: cytochrome c [Chloroflexi bacterium]|nr:cytochrome c [Chloroflexota bacterium]
MGKLVVLGILLVAGVFLISCAKAQPPPTPAPPPPSPVPASARETSTTDAAKLFATNCAVCHGERRQGVSGLGPALSPASLAKLSDAEIRNTTLKGRPNTAMAGFEGRLSSMEIDAIVQLIKDTSP